MRHPFDHLPLFVEAKRSINTEDAFSLPLMHYYHLKYEEDPQEVQKCNPQSGRLIRSPIQCIIPSGNQLRACASDENEKLTRYFCLEKENIIMVGCTFRLRPNILPQNNGKQRMLMLVSHCL